MGKRGPAPLDAAVLKARGSEVPDRRARSEKAAESRPPRSIPSVPVISDEAMWAGIPGYDPRLQSDGATWDRASAERAVRFFHERLTHVKGFRGPFILEPWQQAVIGNLFGWKRPDGTRRYRRLFLYVPKKQGKTPVAAGLAVYLLSEMDEPGIEVYSAAYNKDQASIIFKYAAGMVRNDDYLSGRLDLFGLSGGSQQRSIVRKDDKLSSYRPLADSPDAADGAQVYAAIVDELHRHKDAEMAEILEKGTAARDEPMVIYTTTAATSGPNVCNEKLAYARAVRDNGGDPAKPGFDPSYLPVIYEASASDDWRSEATWRKANPNYGVTVKPEYFREAVRVIDQQPAKLNEFLRLHLNIVTDAAEAALPMEAWDAGPAMPTEEELLAHPCYGGGDLSSTIDLTAFALYWPALRAVKAWFWRPKDTLQDAEHRDRVPYRHWASKGLLELTEGSAIEEQRIIRRWDEIATQYRAVEIGVDRAYGGRTVAMALIERGHKVTEIAQGHFSLAPPCRELERLVVTSSLRHGGHPILRWNASCLAWRKDTNDNICFDKRKSTGRIDGIAALVMAIGLATLAAQPAEPSISEL